MRRTVLTVGLAALLVLAGCSGGGDVGAPAGGGNGASGGNGDGGIGMAVGGAQDASSFRTNVEEGYVPQPTDMTYEGLFHDYYFDTAQQQQCEELFCPSFSRGVARDPLSNETERYMTVGLNSGLSKADFQRKKLNLVVVLDTSGSMGSPFSQYYYDGEEKKTVESSQSKLSAASDAISTMLGHLREGDRVGVVTFDDRARTLEEMTAVGELDVETLRERVQSLSAGGGTNFDNGMATGTEMLEPYRNPNASEYETRVVYLTDAMPNQGQIEAGPLGNRLRDNADDDVYTTFLGVGVDFNSRLVESITDIEGANYYSVHSPSQFAERMDEGFQYMVTPLVFDLRLEITNGTEVIEHVYGTTDEAASTGRLLEVTTLFPSRTEGNRTEGGVVLFELADEADDGTVTVETSYTDRTGERHTSTRTVELGTESAPYYDSTGVRKAIVLSRYATLMRNWAAFERANRADGDGEVPAEGIERVDELGTWEQQSVPLRVSERYRDRIERFERYFRAEMDALDAGRMDQDLRVLEQLTENATASTREPGTG